MPKAQVNQINRLINSLDITKATGPDSIPPKLVKLSSNIIDSHLCNIINQDIENANFSDGAKVASVRPIFKKKERIEIENYRPVSVLNVFSEVYEKYILETLSPFIDNFLFQFISAYRKSCLFSWIFKRPLTASLMIFLLQNYMHMVLIRKL